MNTFAIRRVGLYVLLIVALLSSTLQFSGPVAAQDQTVIDPPDRSNEEEPRVISGPIADAALDLAPAPDRAVVVDPANPNWQTVYGTEAGRQLLPPRRSEVPAQIEGATPPLSGFWITRTIQSGTNGITAIAYAPDGRLFAGLSNGGLRAYGPNASGIYGWTSITASPGGLPSNYVSSLAIFNGDLWVGTFGFGVGVYDLNSGTWSNYTVANSPLPHDTVNRLTPVVDPNVTDYIWISTSGGAAKYTPTRPFPSWNIINTVDGLPSNTVYDVAVDIDGATVTTYFANYGGLTTWNGTTFSNSQGSGSCLFNYPKRVIVDRQDRLWVTPVDIVPERGEAPQVDITAGVCRRTFNGFTYTWTRYNTTSPGLPNNDVSDLSEDHAGRIWLSMQGATGGGAVYDNGTWKLYTTPTSPLLSNDLRRVLAVGEAIWWGQGGANAFSVHSPNWLRFSNVPGGETPQAIFNEATRTWVGGESKIAYTNGGAFTTIPIPGNTGYVSSFARDANNHLWIGTSGNGVYDYNNVTFTPHTTASGLPNNGVNALLSDQLGRIWAGTNGGLAMRAEASYWLTFTTSTSPIAGNIVQALARDSADRLWIGTASGLSVYNLTGGGNPWISYTTANGLPANQVTGLTSDSAGNMWVSTYGGGVAVSNALSNTWTVYSTTAYVPHTQTLSITSDPTGRLWTTTLDGLVLRQGNTWRTFRVPETALDSHRLDDVVADADRTWVEGDSTLAVRGVITSPIGNFVPAISSFSPVSASPGATIIINGNYFDNRGPEFNIVKFPDMNHFPTMQAEVISVTTTSIAVKVPLLASSGKLQVEANGLKSPLSAVEFKLMPKITSISPTCLSVGSELKISGLGFLDGSAAAYVKIGSGAERIADATDPTQLRTFIRPGDATGSVRVRLLNNNQVTADQSLTVATINVNSTAVQQAIQGEQLVWGKRTLVQILGTSVGCGGAQITRASLTWKFTSGYTVGGGTVNFPGGKSLPTNAPGMSVDNAVSIPATLDISSVADDLNFPQTPFISSLPFFNGVDVVLRNNNVDVLTVNIPKSKFNFVDTAGVRRRITLMRVTGNTAAEQDADFHTLMFANMGAAARLFPQQDGRYYGGRYYWLYDTVFWFSTIDKVNIDPVDGNHEDARDEVEDFLDPGGNRWAVALIDRMNIAAGSSAGISSSGWRTVVAINGDDTGGRLIIHELMHAFGFVDSDASNYQQSDVPGEDHHSKYNEGRWGNFNNCSSSRTYKQALIDQAGGNKRVVRLISGNVPVDLRTAACNSAAEDDQSNTAKSIISYSPNRDNFNTVMEPMDWRNMITQLCEDGGCVGFAGLTALNAPMGIAAPVTAKDVTRTLRIGGRINLSATLGSQVTTTISYVGLNDGEVTPQDFGGDAHLIVRDAGNTILHDQTFVLEESALSPHDSNTAARSVGHGSAPDHAGVAAVSLFHLRVPFPDNAVSVEISHDGDVLWSKTISANAPTVNVTAPNGGTFNAADPITMTWTANDLDGDPLQYGLDFSADDGATWLNVAPYITSTSIIWTPNFVTATNTARVRIRASDGFNTAYSTSAQFTLTPRAPEAIILSPESGGIYAEGEVIDLEGTSLTSSGPDAGAFTWKVNNVTVGNTRTVTTPLTAIGVSTITLQVTANALSDSRSITVTVIPDYDRDRMSNAWESQYQFNPLDPTDAAGDADNDGLSNIDESRLGTHPRSSDTDGDSFSDSVEIDAGTDPLVAASQPIATPLLNVGSVSMGFTINNYSSLPGPKSTWVTNLGGGALNYTATTDAAWLTATPAAGSAPQELTVWANSIGMPIGVYQGHVTVTSPGVAGSPQTITVTMTIDSLPNLKHVYLPLIRR